MQNHLTFSCSKSRSRWKLFRVARTDDNSQIFDVNSIKYARHVAVHRLVSNQKKFTALYHMGLYANPPLLKWFMDEYKKRGLSKLDMAKSCIRFKKAEHIPFDLIGELASKITPGQWIQTYEASRK